MGGSITKEWLEAVHALYRWRVQARNYAALCLSLRMAGFQ